MIKKSFLFPVFFFFILSFSLYNPFSFFSDASLEKMAVYEINEESKFNQKNSFLNSASDIQSPFLKIHNGLENIIETFAKRITKTQLNWKHLSTKFYKKNTSVYDIIIGNPQLYSLPGCIILHQLRI